MDWRDTPKQKTFRGEVRRFIRERFPKEYRPDTQGWQSLEPEDVTGFNWTVDRLSQDPVRRKAARQWAQALAEKGWIAPHWPKEYGGAGLHVNEEFILLEEMMRAGVPTVNGIGVFLLGPTLLQYGTEEQCRQHLPKISRGEVTWAQGFSEPEAGSDLASLRTRAVRDGDIYVVNGQKTWISLAQYSDWLFVLARTDPNEQRHRGITFLLIDTQTPGITIRPIKDMRGAEPFAEVFFDDVRVPVSNRIGEENRGWYVAMATLSFERSGIGATIKYEQSLERLIELIRSPAGQTCLSNNGKGSMKHDIVQRYIEIRVLYNLALHTMSKQSTGEMPDYEASINQLFSSELHQRLAHTSSKVLGLYGTLLQGPEAPLEGAFARDNLDAVAHTFLAGTTEVQRNVIAVRGLGLPRK